MPDFLEPFVGNLYAHPYLFMFVGMLFVGEVVLLPAIYLAVTGRLELLFVIAIAVAATVLSDLVWYYAGRKFPASALQRLPGRGTNKLINGLERLFDRRGAYLVFLSKFVYGTRTAAQILAGVHDVPFRAYLMANTLGVATLTLVLSAAAWVVAGTARRYGDDGFGVEIAFVAFLIIAATGFFSAARMARRQWSQ